MNAERSRRAASQMEANANAQVCVGDPHHCTLSDPQRYEECLTSPSVRVYECKAGEIPTPPCGAFPGHLA